MSTRAVRVLWPQRANRAAEVALCARAVIGSRLIIWMAGLGALAAFGRDPRALVIFDPQHFTEPFATPLANALFAPAARWDSVWYLQIAHSGYQSAQDGAFFPLYPFLVHLGGVLLGSDLVAGALLSVVAMAVGMQFLYRLACLELGESAASATVLLVAFFPTSLFLSAVYSDALFLALTVGALYAARLERWAWAGVLGALAATTRSGGFMIALPLLLLYLYGPLAGNQPARPGWWRPRYALGASSLWLGLVPLGVLAYLAYQATLGHGLLSPFHAEAIWGRRFAGPFGAIFHAAAMLPGDLRGLLSGSPRAMSRWDPLSWNAHDLLDLGFLAFAVAGLMFARRRLPLAYFAYALVTVAEALSAPTPNEPLESFGRYALAAFPVFMGWGAVLGERRALRRAMLATSAVVLAAFSGLWAIWAWLA